MFYATECHDAGKTFSRRRPLCSIHVVLDTVYRPWAWSVRCADAHLADSFTKITSDMGLSALMVLFEGRRWWSSQISSWLTVLVPVLSMVIYELVQTVLPWGRFDPWDVAWTFAGGGIALIVKRRWEAPVW